MKDTLKGIVFIGLFLVPFLPVYVANDFFFPFITGKNFAFRIIIEIIFAAWVLLALYEPKYRPKFSWILAGFGAFLAVMAVANALGEYPLQSFWSNFERMDGYVTLVHLFLFVVVAGSVLTTKKLWEHFFHLSLAIAICVALYGMAQYFSLIPGTASSRARIDSRLGNAAYMAVYMLFHIFILYWFVVRSKINTHKILYGLTAIFLIYTLLLTGTRGTFLGFVGGTAVMVGYIAIFGRLFPEIRKIAIGACVAVVLVGAGFWAIKDSELVQSQGAIARIANISISKDLVVRGTIWSMALEGVKERPLLGWGQSNFNYVFNEKYDPSLYAAESWFDRTHDIFLDWLIAGGIFGLIAYFSIFFAALYYLLLEPLLVKKEKNGDTAYNKKNDGPTFDVLERGVLIGLLVGYLLHNIVVFDNIISYIFYGSILAFIHAHASRKIAKVDSLTIDQQLIGQFVAPIVILIVGATVYFVNVPGIMAARDIIDAMQSQTAQGRLMEFHNALERNSYIGRQEIVEQLAQQAMSAARNPNLKEEDRKALIQRAELELLSLNDDKPGDARLHTFLSSFYRTIGALPEAQEQAALAREASPRKQAIITEQGIIELQLGNVDKATEYLKTAFELDESNTQARVLYAGMLVGSSKADEANQLLTTDVYFKAFALNDFALSMVDQGKDRELLAKMFEVRIVEQPDSAQNRASLAYVYYELGKIPEAVAVLEKAAEDLPSFAKSSQCFIDNLNAGEKPDKGC